MQQFLNLLLKTLKEEEELIDEEMAKGKYQESEKFKKSFILFITNYKIVVIIVMSNIRLSFALNNLMPFVLNFILTDYNKATYYGFEKKLLYVKLLLNLINNQSINHEFHVIFFDFLLLY